MLLTMFEVHTDSTEEVLQHHQAVASFLISLSPKHQFVVTEPAEIT